MSNIYTVYLGADGKFSAAEKLTETYHEILDSDCKVINIDASNIYWVSPFTACWFSALYDNIISQDKEVNIIEPTRDNATHQWHNLGISKYLGLSKDIKSLSNLPAFQVTKLTEPSYPLAGKVTKILTSRLRGVENFHKALHFAIRETIENSFEHGQTNHCYMCAYSVPTKNVVRLCILDTGIGIPESIRKSERYDDPGSDFEAVKLSSEYGVSSKSEDRGIGLYILRDVVEKNEGSLSILSGYGLLEINSESKNKDINFHFPGTVIKLLLRTRMDFRYLDVASWDEL